MSEPLESALGRLREISSGGPTANLYLPNLPAGEARALLAEIERLRAQIEELQHERDEAMVAFGSYCMPKEIGSRIRELQARPTREQALRAMELWTQDIHRVWHDRNDLHTHGSPEDCLDAAMREPGT